MVILYDIFFVIFSLLYLPYLFIKGKAHRGLWQRLGFINSRRLKAGPIWIHAVSVGEVQVASLLVNALGDKAGGKLVVSTVTTTGNNLARSLLKDKAEIIYAPLDISFIINRFLIVFKPRALVLVETELWPNLIYGFFKRKIPIILINGRISPHSFSGYRRVKFLARGILDKINLFCMQTEEDKAKIVALGAPPDKVKVTGNMKFDNADYAPAAMTQERDYKTKLGFAPESRVWVAGSTHPSEEKALLTAYRKLVKEFSGLKLLIAPRHIERALEVQRLAASFGFGASMMSQRAATLKEMPDVFILDTIGQLKDVYNIAEVVFMGGSLVKKGGQNILEPAAFAKPIIFGPYMFNFARISALYLSKGAAIEVKNQEGLEIAVRKILSNPNEAEAMGRRAREIIFEHRGATARNVELIGKLLDLKC